MLWRVKICEFISKSFREKYQWNNAERKEAAQKNKEREWRGFARCESQVIQKSASRDFFIIAPLMNFEISQKDRLR